MELGERIRRLRKLHGMTMETLAKRVGVTRQTISRYETGSIEDIPQSKLESVATALGVSSDYLRGWTLESQCDSLAFDIQQQKEALQSASSDNEREEIEQAIDVLEESYRDIHFVLQYQNVSPVSASKKPSRRLTIGSRVKEWRSDKKSRLTMDIDSWLLLALKGMAADSNRSLFDEIENALYDYVMAAIDDEPNG